MSRHDELSHKRRRVEQLLTAENLDALLLSKHGNFAWITCGGSNHVAVNAEVGAAHALITRDAGWVLCDNIEAQRIMHEEIADLGFAVESWPWPQEGLAPALRSLVGGASIGSDTGRPDTVNVEPLLPALRAGLLPQEIRRYRELGALTAEAMTEACLRIEPGMTEHRVAGLLGGEMLARGVFPVVLLVAADERAFKYRHPLPTDATVNAHVMLVACGRKWGLILSMTRLVHFGPLPDDLRRKHDAVARVDATFIANTRPGARVGDIFDAAVQAYADAGFPDEWHRHHQGGPTGYAGREFRATSGAEQAVVENQAFAWNPSIAGTKSEDTIIALASGPEVVSPTPRLPALKVEVDGALFTRADIVQR